MITAKRLRELREKKDLSQSDLARLLKIDRSTVSKWEKGELRPTRKLEALSDFYNVSTDYILGKETNTSSVLPPTMNIPLNYSVVNEAIDKALNVHQLGNYLDQLNEAKRVPIIGSVRCGPDGLAFQMLDGFVFVSNDEFKGSIIAFRCKGDSMKDVNICDGDLAIVRQQDDVESGEIAVVVIDGEEGTLKRVRKLSDCIILEAANPEYEPRMFTNDNKHTIKIVGKLLEIRKRF